MVKNCEKCHTNVVSLTDDIYACLFLTFFRQLDEEERARQLQNLLLEMVKLRDNMEQALAGCRHKEYLPETVKKYQDTFKQIFECVEKIVQVGLSLVVVMLNFVTREYAEVVGSPSDFQNQ